MKTALLLVAAIVLAACTGPPAPPGGPPGDGAGPGTSAGSGGTGDNSAVQPADAETAGLMETLHRASWLCQDTVTVADSDPKGSALLRCEVSLEFTDTHVVVTSTGIPNHDLDSGVSPDKTAEQSKTWRIPLQPRMADEPTWAPDRGAIALAANGAAIYGPEEGSGGAAVANQYGYYEEDREIVELGVCDGHAGPGGEYHYHADANCMHWHVENGKVGAGYSWDEVDPSVHSKIIGFAFDGFPVYGSYAWEAGTTDVVEILSSYRFKTPAEGGQDGYNGMDDFLYEEGAGHLDDCNGRFHATPEFPNGTYAYHSTRHSFDGSLGFPHFLTCYRGVVETSNVDGGGEMQPGGAQGGPPPSGGSSTGTHTGPPPTGGPGGPNCTGPDGRPVEPRPDGSCPTGPPP